MINGIAARIKTAIVAARVDLAFTSPDAVVLDDGFGEGEAVGRINALGDIAYDLGEYFQDRDMYFDKRKFLEDCGVEE